MKRFLTLLAFVALAITANAVIQSGTCGANVTFVLNDDGTFIISGSGKMKNYYINNSSAPWYNNRSKIIKVQIENGVTSIGDYAFYNCSALKSVTIPNSVTSIGDNALNMCSSLTSVTIPNSVTSIGNSAFYGCSSLTSVTIPNSVTSIGKTAFSDCSGMTSLKVEVGNQNYCSTDNVLFNKDKTELIYCVSGKKGTFIIPNSVSSIEEYAFAGCSNLTSITIPNSVTSIGTRAFSYCSGLTSIDIPNSVTSIGTSVFYYCSGLISVTIPNSVTSIDAYAFYNCSSLASVTIPSSVTSIGNSAFGYCSSLTSVTIPNSVTRIDTYAFYNCSKVKELIYAEGTKTVLGTSLTSITSVTIPSSVTSIGNGAFYGCSFLTSVNIPNSVTSIGDNAFNGCSSLTSITIPNSVTSIDAYAFYNCSSLTSITVPNSVTSIGNRAFYKCSGLTSITIPNSVMNIGDYAFNECSGLTSVTIPNSVTSIGTYAFYGCKGLKEIYSLNPTPQSIDYYTFYGVSKINTKVYVPAYAVEVYKSANYWKQFSKILPIEDNVIQSGSCGDKASFVLYDDGTMVIFGSGDMYNYSENYINPDRAPWYDNRKKILKVQIEDGVTSIGDRAFSNCSSLTSITIPNSVESIGRDAFFYCSNLTSVTIGNSVTRIGDGAFQSCYSLTSIDIPNSVTSIGVGAFSSCSSLTSVTIPNSLTNLGGGAFFGCMGLTSITIPESVKNIGNGTFGKCRNLVSIVVEEGNPNYCSIDNVLFNKDKTELLRMPCNKVGEYVIPNTVTRVGDFAFDLCSRLTSITIPNSVTSIGNGAFDGCEGLTSITIPNSVTSIGDVAFNYCEGLKEIYSLNPTPPSIAYNAFQSVDKTNTKLYVPADAVEAYKAADYWNEFSNIIPLAKSSVYNISDGEDYVNTEDAQYEEISYTRSFSNANVWQALYLPFSIDVEQYKEEFDIAEIFAFCPYLDTNKDGEVTPDDGDMLVVFKKSSGTTDPNVPYLIRPKEAKSYTLQSCDGMLYAATDGSVNCSTTKRSFTITGVNTATQATADNQLWYMTGTGTISHRLTGSTTVKAFRWVMSIEDRFDNYSGGSKESKSKEYRVAVIGEDNSEVTGINAINKDSFGTNKMYMLNGIEVKNTKNLPKGIYIVNGKKVHVK